MNPNLVFKLSYHIVEGNRFALPMDVADYLAAYQKKGVLMKPPILLFSEPSLVFKG